MAWRWWPAGERRPSAKPNISKGGLHRYANFSNFDADIFNDTEKDNFNLRHTDQDILNHTAGERHDNCEGLKLLISPGDLLEVKVVLRSTDYDQYLTDNDTHKGNVADQERNPQAAEAREDGGSNYSTADTANMTGNDTDENNSNFTNGDMKDIDQETNEGTNEYMNQPNTTAEVLTADGFHFTTDKGKDRGPPGLEAPGPSREGAQGALQPTKKKKRTGIRHRKGGCEGCRDGLEIIDVRFALECHKCEKEAKKVSFCQDCRVTLCLDCIEAG